MRRSLGQRGCGSVARACVGSCARAWATERRAEPLQRSANGATTATTEHGRHRAAVGAEDFTSTQRKETVVRSPTTVLAATAAVALSACGSGEDPGATAITAQAAKASVERSARIELAPQAVPAEAHEQGLESAFSNAATAAEDRQAVVVFLLEDAGVADKVGDLVRGSVPEPSRLIVKDNVMVVYAAAGKDRAAQVEQAVEAL
jgi:hypothetical protein